MNIGVIVNSNSKIKMIIYFFITLLVVLLGYIFDIRKQQLMLHKEANLQLTLLATLEQQKHEFLTCQNAQRGFLRTPVLKKNLGAILAEITLAARQNQLGVETVVPKLLSSKNTWQVQTVHLILVGTYYHFQAWVHSLQRLPHWLNLTELSLQQKNNKNYLTADIKLDVYS